jgi:hypothetical protein
MAHFFHAAFSPLGQNLKARVYDCSETIAEPDTAPIIHHLNRTFFRKTVIEEAALGPLPAIQNVRFRLDLIGNSTAAAKFYLDEPKEENVIMLAIGWAQEGRG